MYVYISIIIMYVYISVFMSILYTSRLNRVPSNTPVF